jgi:hypothetical protein
MINVSGLRLTSRGFELLFVSGDTCGVIGSEMIGTGFSGISLVEFLNNILSMFKVRGSEPLIFFVSSFITHPSNIVVQFARRPASEVVFRVQDVADFVFDFAFNFNGFRRRWLTVGKSIRNGGLDLRDVEYGMEESEFMRESETNGVLAYTVNDLEGTEVWFGELASRSSCPNILGEKEDHVARVYFGWRNSSLIGGNLISFLSELERIGQVLVKFVEVGCELTSAE